MSILRNSLAERSLACIRTGECIPVLAGYRILCELLCIAIALSLPGWAQGSSQATTPGGLKLVVIQGDNASNNLAAHSAVQPVVEVRDENDRPVADADVEFELPVGGPSAVFDTWLRRQSVKTDSQGRARTRDMMPNDRPGRFTITVTATYKNKSGTVTMTQTNTRGGKSQGGVEKSNKKIYIIVGVAAIAAIAGGVAATRNGSTTTAATTNPVSISAGPITVGGPR